MSVVGVEDLILQDFVPLTIVNRTRRISTFEMIGLDVLIDENMKTYLLEINNTPSMAAHTNLENKIKQDVIRDLFTLVDIENDDFDAIDRITDAKWPIMQKLKEPNPVIEKNGKTLNATFIVSRENMFVIVETELENMRRIKGGYERAFPVSGGEMYLPYLVNPRNKMIMEWLNSGMTLDDIVI